MRRHVLGSLWRAEEVAGDFVAGSAPNAAVRPARMNPRHGHDPADAMALACTLRFLALMVRNMAARMRRAGAMLGQLRDDGAISTLSKSAFAAVELRDTS